MFYGVIISSLLVGVLIYLASKSHPRNSSRMSLLLETLVAYTLQTGRETFGSESKARKHLPFLMSLFLFILFSNLSGLLPGVGSITITNDGVASPLLRPLTTDLNATLGLAIFTIVSVQVYALRELGIMGHLKHYFSNEPWKPMNLFIGINEVLGEFIRIITLSMRLFGVIYAGKVLLYAVSALAGNLGWAAAVPITFLEIFFSLIQAYIFMMLTMVYLAIATSSEEDPKVDKAMLTNNLVKGEI
jgi:F-type H+-transporting ATPase subunit a